VGKHQVTDSCLSEIVSLDININSEYNLLYLARVVGELDSLHDVVVLVPDQHRKGRMIAYVVPENW
jgi:hypothetical protein